MISLKEYFWNILLSPQKIQKIDSLVGAIVDPKGFGFFNLMLENANVPKKYRYMFCPKNDNAVFIDCGANVGLITDIARFMDMEVYAFEPNPQAIRLLNKKYMDDKMVHLYPNAVSHKTEQMKFFVNPKIMFDDGATLVDDGAIFQGNKTETINIDVLRLVDVIKQDILPKHKKVHLLKLDIEGAEFDVINDIIDEGLYNSIKYIVVETHERFFKDGKLKMKNLQQKIKEKNITNIYLDWI